MAKKQSMKLKKGNWVEWEEGAEIRLRPFPASQSKVNQADIDMEFTMEVFNYCVMDWKGIVEDTKEEKSIPCNKETKEYMFDYNPEMLTFVMETLKEIMGVEDKEKKN